MATRTHDPETSHEAEASVTPHITAIQTLVLQYAEYCGEKGFTDLQLERTYPNYVSSTLRTRRRELQDKGLIVDTGRRVTVGSNRRRIVWRIK